MSADELVDGLREIARDLERQGVISWNMSAGDGSWPNSGDLADAWERGEA